MIIITVITIRCRYFAYPWQMVMSSYSFFIHPSLFLAFVPSTWSTFSNFNKGMMECSSLNSSAQLSSLSPSAPYLTSFPTTLHYTPFTVVKPVSLRHRLISLGLSSCWNALLPLLHLFILLTSAPSFLIHSSNIYWMSTLSGIMLSVRLQQRKKQIGFLSPCCLLSCELSSWRLLQEPPRLPLNSLLSYLL